jgi:signal transduction histidine kinase/CheY-like chemotaxis protein
MKTEPAVQHPSAARPPLALTWRTWVLTLALWTAVAAAVALALWQLRREAVQAQVRELNLLALALGDDMERGLRGAEEGLEAVREELREGMLAVHGVSTGPALRTRATLMPLVSRLWLVDREGRLLAASHADPPPKLASFGAALDAAAGGRLAFGLQQPPSPATALVLAFPFEAPASSAGGWALAGVPPQALLGNIGLVGAAADATSMAVFGPDGNRLEAVGRPPAVGPAGGKREEDLGDGTSLRRGDDGQALLATVRAIPRYGLQVVVARDLDIALRSWRQTAEAAAAGLLLLLAILSAAVHFALLAEHRHTEAQRLVEAQSARASRLEALGTLAGGVAHDFNNVLAAVVGYGEMARDEATPDSDQARYLDHVLQAASRGKAMVDRILGVSRVGTRPSIVFEPEPVVEEVLTMLSATLRPGVVLERLLDAPAARLRGDPTRLLEAVLNLCNNAMQAMPQGGMLTVQTRRVPGDPPGPLSHGSLGPGKYLAVTVADQGAGFTADVADHLFEPFFTTRAHESGTGLGLAVVQAVVTEFHGAIDVDSTPGAGSAFTLYLPETAEPEARAAAGETPAAWQAGTGGCVLVVDDDAGLVAMVQEMLGALGYPSRGETDPRAALEVLRAQPQDFAALITDEMMPAMSGTQLARAVREFHPRLPVLLVSGYGGASLASRAQASGVRRVLSKPLERRELGQALADALH